MSYREIIYLGFFLFWASYFVWEAIRFHIDLVKSMSDETKKDCTYSFGCSFLLIGFGTHEYQLRGYTVREFRLFVGCVRYTYKDLKEYKPLIHNSSPITHHSK